MKNVILSAVALSMLMGAAAQAEVSQGRIASIAPGHQSFSLASGEAFTMDASKDQNSLSAFRQGDSVTVNWIEQGNRKIASSVGGANGDHTTGQIVSMDSGAGIVTLDNGRTYSFQGDARNTLKGYRKGDLVAVVGAGDSVKNGAIPASAVGSINTNSVVSAVQKADAARGKLTLSDGMTFTVPEGDLRAALAGLLPGDSVHVFWTRTGSAMTATAINPVNS